MCDGSHVLANELLHETDWLADAYDHDILGLAGSGKYVFLKTCIPVLKLEDIFHLKIFS